MWRTISVLVIGLLTSGGVARADCQYCIEILCPGHPAVAAVLEATVTRVATYSTDVVVDKVTVKAGGSVSWTEGQALTNLLPAHPTAEVGDRALIIGWEDGGLGRPRTFLQGDIIYCGLDYNFGVSASVLTAALLSDDCRGALTAAGYDAEKDQCVGMCGFAAGLRPGGSPWLLVLVPLLLLRRKVLLRR